MLNKNRIQNKIPLNSIRLQKSNSETNHTNKKIFKETKHYIINKKNKIPREKIIQNNHNSKQKQKAINNLHPHVLSKISPFCKICGSINYKNNESNRIIESIKPHNYYYSPEFSITSMIKCLKYKTNYEYQSIFSEFKHKKFDINIIMIRNKIINKFIDYSKKILVSKNTIYLAIILMDIILLKKNINVKKKIELISLGCYFLAVKFLDFAVNSFGIREYQFTNEIAISYSVEQIRKFEVICLIDVNYNLNIINFINVLQIFLANGILLKKDIKKINSEQSLKNIYFLINKISENLICEDMIYIQYNQFNMACAILYLSRNISKLDPWPKTFTDIYNINFEDFSEEYNYVNNFYENNILITNFGNKKRQRNNSTCKNINVKRINFNSTFNNNFRSLMNNNENININNINKEKKVKNNGTKDIVLHIFHYNNKRNNFDSNGSIKNNNNNSLIVDTTSNIINFLTNNDSSKKKYNNSSGKANIKNKSQENNYSKEKTNEKLKKILNSSSKHIRIHKRLMKNNHQFAFNQSMEMPRKTCIFEKRIYHSRSKRFDIDNKINSNRSQKSDMNYYNCNYNSNKNSNKLLNENYFDYDKKYKDDNLINCKNNNEKKNKFRKMLNNSEIQIKKKNNSQTNLLPFNIQKSSSVKLIVDNSKKNLSNYSNSKIDKYISNLNINNNNSTNNKDNKYLNNNIKYYYSNVKLKNDEIKNRYIYNNNSNIDINKKYNNSTVKKEYNMSKDRREITSNLSFITITDSYNLNSQKKKVKNNDNHNNNIKIIDNYNTKNKNSQKCIDNYQSKKTRQKNRLSHIKYNSCINAKVYNINLLDEKSLGFKKEINSSHKKKNLQEYNNLHKNYYTNIIFNKNNNNSNNNIIIKINLVNKKFDINKNYLINKNIKKNNEGIGVIKKIKINNNNIRRKETTNRKRIDSNVSSAHFKNNNSNNNSSLFIPNNRSNGTINCKNNSDENKNKNSKNSQIKNNRYYINKKGRNYSVVNQKKIKISNSSL